MSVSASRSRLATFTKDLLGHWQQTQDCWKDDRSREFGEKYLDELVTGVNRVVTDLESLDKVIAKIRDECE